MCKMKIRSLLFFQSYGTWSECDSIIDAMQSFMLVKAHINSVELYSLLFLSCLFSYIHVCIQKQSRQRNFSSGLAVGVLVFPGDNLFAEIYQLSPVWLSPDTYRRYDRPF